MLSSFSKRRVNINLDAFDTNRAGSAPRQDWNFHELCASGKTPDLIAPFAVERFHTDTLVSELAAAAVSH